MLPVATDKDVEPSGGRFRHQPNHHPGVTPGRTRMHDPDDVRIVVEFNAGRNHLRTQPVGDVTLQEQSRPDVHAASVAQHLPARLDISS